MKRLLIAVACVAIVMSALACVRWSIWSYGSDTGTFAQTIFNAPAGFTNAVEPSGTHLRTHWSPILALLWPLVAATRSPLSIQFVQIALIALTVVPLFAIVRRRAGDAWALRCSVLALIYPPLLANAFNEFHELAFYPIVALALVWAADTARWTWFALFALAGVTIREDACATLAVFGLALAAAAWRSEDPNRNGRVAAGVSLAALSAGALAFYALAVLPRYGSWKPAHFYAHLSAADPLGRLTYVLEAFAPQAFLPLLSRWTLLAVPGFAGILLANDAGVWRMGTHYILLAVPWLLLGTSFALLRIARDSGVLALRWWRTAVALCVVFLVAFDPMHPLHYLRAEPYQHTAYVERAMSCVPRGAPILTHDEWFAHFAVSYPGARFFLKPPERFRGYVVFASDWGNRDFANTILPKLRAGEAAGRYRRICRYGDVLVLEST